MDMNFQYIIQIPGLIMQVSQITQAFSVGMHQERNNSLSMKILSGAFLDMLSLAGTERKTGLTVGRPIRRKGIRKVSNQSRIFWYHWMDIVYH
jgi:hypothetical protein